MIQKLEKLLDLAAEALSLYIDDTRSRRGEALPLGGKAESTAVATEVKPKRTKKTVAAEPTAPVDSPFSAATPAQVVEAKLPPEEALEAGRRGQEVMGLFIRRYLKASPTGLDRAKGIIENHLGKPRNGEMSWKLEHFTPQDWLKLTPIFEAELDKAA